MSLFEPKTNENISVFLPYLSKIGQIKKRRQIIILEDKQSYLEFFFWKWAIIFMIWPILEARAEIQKYFGSFFGSNENFKICFPDLLTFKPCCAHCIASSKMRRRFIRLSFSLNCTSGYSSIIRDDWFFRLPYFLN